MMNSKWTRVFAVAMAALMLPLLAAAKGRVMPTLSPHSTAHVSSTAAKPKAMTSTSHGKPKPAAKKSKKASIKSSKSKSKAAKLHAKSTKATKLSAKPAVHGASKAKN